MVNLLKKTNCITRSLSENVWFVQNLRFDVLTNFGSWRLKSETLKTRVPAALFMCIKLLTCQRAKVFRRTRTQLVGLAQLPILPKQTAAKSKALRRLPCLPETIHHSHFFIAVKSNLKKFLTFFGSLFSSRVSKREGVYPSGYSLSSDFHIKFSQFTQLLYLYVVIFKNKFYFRPIL
jgi:hypothetical protein